MAVVMASCGCPLGVYSKLVAFEKDGSYLDTDAVPTPKVIIDQDSDPNASVEKLLSLEVPEKLQI